MDSDSQVIREAFLRQPESLEEQARRCGLTLEADALKGFGGAMRGRYREEAKHADEPAKGGA